MRRTWYPSKLPCSTADHAGVDRFRALKCEGGRVGFGSAGYTH